MTSKVAVAMSVYKSDSAFFLSQAIESVLAQTYKNFHLYIAIDGVIPEDLRTTINNYLNFDNVTVLFNNDNLGLATRLNQIIDIVLESGDFSYIARMDADDICDITRFDKQIAYLMRNNDISVVGSDVIEISSENSDIFYKKMSAGHDEILSKIIKKCPFNHPSVMFRVSVFQSGRRYDSKLMNTQDYYLWIDLLVDGIRFANINEPLVKFRINDTFHSRRGLKKAINDFKSRVYAFKHLDVLNFGNVIYTMALFLLRISPSYIKKLAYDKLR